MSTVARSMSNHVVDSNQREWFHLRTGKEFSRLLYPNPVCFLSTIRPSPSLSTSEVDGGDVAGGSASAFVGGQKNEAGERSASASFNPLSTTNSHTEDNRAKRNIMTISWLTPTNNRGGFMFSIHKSRYSASLLAPPIDSTMDAGRVCRKKRPDSQSNRDNDNDDECTTNNNNNNLFFQSGVQFTLSVPVRGMERMVLDVGSISGRFGEKFPGAEGRGNKSDEAIEDDNNPPKTMSNRQRKKLKKQELSLHGIEGLIPIPFPGKETTSETEMQKSPSSLFVIDGTVAYLKCRTRAILGTPLESDTANNAKNTDEKMEKSGNEAEASEGNQQQQQQSQSTTMIDEDHLLVMAEVTDAHVHPSYWDDQKSLFRPRSSDVPPYLTFFGAQTFGYVMSGNDDERTINMT